MILDIAVIAVYTATILGVGWWGLRRSTTKSDYLVAGRRLGTFMYSAAMSAIVLGGASTVGGIGLGYSFGVSGAWLVTAIGLGILLLSALFARHIVKLRVYTVMEMLDLRYGPSSRVVPAAVMFLYTFMLAVTSTLAYATIFHVLLGVPNWAGILIGGSVVVIYSTLGGMWSITMTDVIQFVIKTIGILLLLAPVAVIHAGGFAEIRERVGDSFFSPTAIGGATIVTYIITYTLGLLIGQDIWQRVFTARTPRIAMIGGSLTGVYCIVYGIAGAVIGMSARAIWPDLPNPDEAFATIVQDALPTGLRGLVLAAALAALMSTASGALIAASTVLTTDLIPYARHLLQRGAAPDPAETRDQEDVRGYRGATLLLGVAVILVATMVTTVVGALAMAYNVLVGGLLIAILGGLVWRRGTRQGATWSMVVGTVGVIVTMAVTDILANEPIYVGLGASLVTYVVVSLLTPPTSEEVHREWVRRLSRSDTTTMSEIPPHDEGAPTR
ncbi:MULTISPECIES: sodium:solute symporter [unclassified Nesterenkonia]|uniref:sodium:solute symporter n=1 Tax=unclassified Nesterenkonia TaxID=2629769 RepID=UPI000872F626|nr:MULTISPECIES: sodium:solute symporter [unclassified Nesterenkonia]MDS2174209.1 sodium:solute symporter [Nesterenkonia sp. CL21]OSM43316.1 sodium:solute symporter [Nesterenkonia sp. PF2B19]